MATGNLIFSGLVQDQVLINRVKREIKMKKILNKKINEHNLKIQEYCFTGRKSLINHWKDPMSLQKIQVELEVVREIDKTLEVGDFDLGGKVWSDFKNWKKEPKHIRKHSQAIPIESLIKMKAREEVKKANEGTALIEAEKMREEANKLRL